MGGFFCLVWFKLTLKSPGGACDSIIFPRPRGGNANLHSFSTSEICVLSLRQVPQVTSNIGLLILSLFACEIRIRWDMH